MSINNTGGRERGSEIVSHCYLCGIEVEWMCDVCERHAMSNEQLAELGRRFKQTQHDYYLELWPELKDIKKGG